VINLKVGDGGSVRLDDSGSTVSVQIRPCGKTGILLYAAFKETELTELADFLEEALWLVQQAERRATKDRRAAQSNVSPG